MLNSRASINKKRKVMKVLKVENMRIGYQYKDTKTEDLTKKKHVQTLEEYVKNRNFLNSKEVFDISLNICEAINNLNYSFMYRQLSPINILVTENMKISFKKIDISKDLQIQDEVTGYLAFDSYTFEKQQRLGKINIEKEIYNLGEIMYFMTTGKLPITRLEPLLEDSYGNNVDSNLKRIIQKCFDIDIKKRYVSIEELKKEIIIELLIKCKYKKTANLSNHNIDTIGSSGNSRIKKANSRKSKRYVKSVVSKISATLSMLLFS